MFTNSLQTGHLKGPFFLIVTDAKIFTPSELIELNLSNNKITGVSVLSGLIKLQKLNLTNNKISDISGLSELINLIEVILSDNRITELSALSSMKKLKVLEIYINEWTDHRICSFHC